MTRPFAEVIGDPIAHSKSPVIHGFWLEALGIDADYRATHVTPDGLAGHFAARRDDRAWRGCNVTIPHKLAVMGLVADRGGRPRDDRRDEHGDPRRRGVDRHQHRCRRLLRADRRAGARRPPRGGDRSGRRGAGDPVRVVEDRDRHRDDSQSQRAQGGRIARQLRIEGRGASARGGASARRSAGQRERARDDRPAAARDRSRAAARRRRGL